MNEDKRKSGRRQQPRRMSDLLHNILPEEERQLFDRLAYSRYLAKDRRAHSRRSGVDRREAQRQQPTDDEEK